MGDAGSRVTSTTRSAPLWLWLALPVLVLGGLALKVSWDLQEEDARQRYQQQLQSATQHYNTLINKTRTSNLYGKTPGQVAAVIGVTKPLKLRGGGGGFEARWVDPVSLAEFEFRFDANKRYTGRSVGWSSSYLSHLVPRPGPLQGVVEKLGRWLCPTISDIFTPLPYLVWLPVLVAYHQMPRHRACLSLALAACGVLFPLVWLMSSFSLLEVKGVMSYDANFWGLIMFGVSLITLAGGGVRDRFDDPYACRRCGYNLRGNTSGVCPECGAALTPSQSALFRSADTSS